MFNDLKWFTVKQLVVYHPSLSMFKIKTTGEPELLATVFSRENRNNNFIISVSNFTLYRKSFSYIGILLLNSIPENIRAVEKFSLFKSEVKKWIFEEVMKF